MTVGWPKRNGGTTVLSPEKRPLRSRATQRRGAWLRLSAAEKWRPTPLEPWRALEEEAEAEEEAGSGRAS